jgi:hypothetical protein
MTADLVTLVLLTALGLIDWLSLRPWYRRWGATDAELERAMVLDAAAFIMTVKMLRGLKRRAEATGAQRHGVATHAA